MVGGSDGNHLYGILNTWSAGSRISHNIIRLDRSGFIYNGHNVAGVFVTDTVAPYGKGELSGDVFIHNNAIYDFKVPNRGINRGIHVQGHKTGHTYCYNNTVYDCALGIFSRALDVVSKNNIVQGCYSAYGANFALGTSNNISDLNEAPGPDSRNGVQVGFADLPGRDFHLAPSEQEAVDTGVNLSVDPNLPFEDDIDGQPRVGVWDIGADERP